jgi:hypothetical protein
MKYWRIKYQISPAVKIFYPAIPFEVKAETKAGARQAANKMFQQHIDFSQVEKVIITDIEPI